MSFGERLREERQRRLLTQEELAETLGVSRRTITRWEQNLAVPRAFALQELSRFFGLSPETFFEELAVQMADASLGSHHDTQRSEHSFEELEAQTAVPPTLLWTVPSPRNPFFTGREELLRTLHRQLTAEPAMAPQEPLALSGLGGIGKTQVAIEYAHRYASQYRAIFWLAAENAESLIPSVQQIAELLQLPECQAAEQARMVLAVQHWLATHSGWLLIADNVEDLDLLQSVLPPLRQGAILLTTRRQALGPLADVVEVPPMSREEGVSLLLARARLLRETAPPHTLPPETPATTGAAELVTLLEGLPLAVDQAGAYIEETGCRVAEYLERYRRQRKHILARRGIGGGHPASVSTTLRLAVERIANQHPAASDLLYLCAFLHPEAIPEELFQAGAAHLESTLRLLVTDPYQFDLALAALRSASLVSRSPETQTLSLHRLVQAVLQDQMEPTEIRLRSELAIRMVNAAFPDGTFETWAHCERLLAQALACVPLIELSSSTRAEAAELFFKAGGYLIARGRYQEAEPLLEQAVTLGEQQHDLDQTILIPCLQRRAQLFWRQGKYADAESLLHRVLQLKELHFGPIHHETAQTLSNLALVYMSQGKYDAAESLLQRAVGIQEETPLETALTLINLANVYCSQGKYDAAEALYVEALGIQEQHLGSEHPTIALTLTSLAAAYSGQGKYQQAEQLYLQASGIREQHLGPEHPQTAYTLHNLANIYRDQGKYEQARPLYLQVRRIREQQLGREHPEVAETLDGLANLYRKLGEFAEAEDLFLQALRIRELHLGPTHPEVAETLNGLANLYRDQGKYEQAESLYQQALDTRMQRVGPTHPHTAFTLHDLANLYRDQGKYQQAESLYQRAQAICEQRLGPDHPRTMQIRNDRGR